MTRNRKSREGKNEGQKQMITTAIDGRIATDPKVQATKNGSKVNFRIASKRPRLGPDGKPITDFLWVTTFRESVLKLYQLGFLTKGKEVTVYGTGEVWTEELGDKRIEHYQVVADNLTLHGSRENGQTPETVTAPPDGSYDNDPFAEQGIG